MKIRWCPETNLYPDNNKKNIHDQLVKFSKE